MESFGYMLRSGVTWSYGSFIFNFFSEASTLIAIKDALVSMTTNSGQMFLFSTPSIDDHLFS